MALIRQANALELTREAVVLDLGDLARQAEQVRARARAEADVILGAAREERDRIMVGAAAKGEREGKAAGLEKGRAEGYAAGREAALEEHGQKLAALEAAWGAALAAFEAARDAMLLEARQDVLKLAVKIGEKVVHRTCAADGTVVVDQVAAALALLTRPTRLTVVVHPDDQVVVKEALPRLCEKLGSSQHMELAADAALTRGSCVVRTAGGGSIDASIGVQIERIAELLVPGTAGDGGAGP